MKSFLLHIFLPLVAFSSFGVQKFCDGAAPPFSKLITVAPSGGGDFTTIGEAIEKGVPENNSQWIHIIIHAGVYKEQVIIPENKPYIVLEGPSSHTTTIAYSTSSDIRDATIQVMADNFVAKSISFKNTYNHERPQNKKTNPIRQGVATYIKGDMVSFYKCGFIGVQDTLYDAEGRHFFKNCYIEGSVDFIFGNGQSVYTNCYLHVTAGTWTSYVTAQSRREIHEQTGFIFIYCVILGTGDVFLGRAWGPYSRVVFYKTLLPGNVNPEGWNAWINKEHVANLTYAEVGCTGLGSDTSKRVKWERKLNVNEWKYFISPSFNNADGWIQNQP